MHSYSVETSVYRGPLDLLLQLIERAELDITRLALASVTNQYLGHLHQVQEQDPDQVSAFLVIASRLILIKSEALLPRPPIRTADEEDPAEALAEQLRQYRQFKHIAAVLNTLQDTRGRTYLHLSPPPKIEARLDLSTFSLSDLRQAAQAILSTRNLPPLNTMMAAPRVTIREKINAIAHRLLQFGHSTFNRLVTGARSRMEIVVTFLAMLELVKRSLIRVHQEGLFQDINIQPTDGLAEFQHSPQILDAEFGE